MLEKSFLLSQRLIKRCFVFEITLKLYYNKVNDYLGQENFST